MTRITRYRLLLTMITAAVFTVIGITALLSHFNLHGVLDPDTIRWIVASLLIEWLAYETYVTHQRAAAAVARLKKVSS